MDKMRTQAMRITRPIVAAALFAAAMAFGHVPARALEIPIGSGAQNLTGANLHIDLRMLESRQQRQAYQDQQQLYRELDRRTNQAGRQRLEVPQMQGSCRLSGPGNNFLKRCR